MTKNNAICIFLPSLRQFSLFTFDSTSFSSLYSVVASSIKFSYLHFGSMILFCCLSRVSKDAIFSRNCQDLLLRMCILDLCKQFLLEKKCIGFNIFFFSTSMKKPLLSRLPQNVTNEKCVYF